MRARAAPVPAQAERESLRKARRVPAAATGKHQAAQTELRAKVVQAKGLKVHRRAPAAAAGRGTSASRKKRKEPRREKRASRTNWKE